MKKNSMSLKVGDYVDVLDEDLSGEVIFIKNNVAKIQTEDDFEFEFETTQLVKVHNPKLLKSSGLDKDTIEKIQLDKSPKKKKATVVKRKERTQPTLEIDLHIHQLVKSYKKMTKHEILTLQLDTAKRQLEFAMRKRIQKIVFIHGVGEGVLKLELEYLFKRYDNIKYYDANYQKYGLGATEVYVYQNS